MKLVLPHCTLRDWRDTDADALARHANDRDVWLKLRDAFPHPYRLEDAHRFLAMVAKQDPTTFFAIEVDGEAAGGIGLMLHTDVERLTAELGYWLAPAYWNKGLMTEAAAAAVRCAFQTIGLHKVTVGCIAENVASRRVIEKLGFRYVGRREDDVWRDGRWWSHLRYEMTAPEWPDVHTTMRVNRPRLT